MMANSKKNQSSSSRSRSSSSKSKSKSQSKSAGGIKNKKGGKKGKRLQPSILFQDLPLEIQFPNWRPAVPSEFDAPFYTERMLELYTFAKDTIQNRLEYLMLSLKFPHDPGMLSLIGTDLIEIEKSSSEDDDEEKKQLERNGDFDDEEDENYRSAFTWRALETDSQNYYDTKRCLKRAFESDWAYSHIEILCSNSNVAESVRKMLNKHYRFLHELFRYECVKEDVGNDLRVTLKGWQSLVKLSLATVGTNIRKSQLDDMFYQSAAFGTNNHINHQHGQHHNKENTAGPGLWRYQFMECLVRLAMARLKNKETLAGGIKMLIEGVLKQKLFTSSHVGTAPGPDFYQDAREFRDSRLYFIQVSQAFLIQEEKLHQLYKAYAKGDGDFSFHSDFKMSMREWCQFCQACGFTLRRYGLNEMNHRLAFVYSQPTMIDPLRGRKQDGGGSSSSSGGGREQTTLAQLSYTDFLEALARIACMLRNDSYPEHGAKLSSRIRRLIKEVLHTNRILIERELEDDAHLARDMEREAVLRVAEEKNLERHHPAPDRRRNEDQEYSYRKMEDLSGSRRK